MTDYEQIAADPAAAGWEDVTAGSFMTYVGPVWRKLENGRPVYGLVAGKRHANHRNIVHGGAIMTFADFAVGMTSVQARGHENHVTAHLDVQFVDAARLGEFLIGRGELMRQTSSLLFLRGTIEANGRLVASATGIWKTVKPLAAV